MAILKSTTVTGNLTLPNGTSAQRVPSPTIIKWTTSGYTVLSGATPAGITNTQFTVPSDVSIVEVLVVGGGGGGGQLGGGGGAGGLIYRSNFAVTPSATLTVTVGAGGTGATGAATVNGTVGGNSVFGSLTAYGGGGGSTNFLTSSNAAGGSGGGGANGPSPIWQGGVPVVGQGYPGGSNLSQNGGSNGGGGGGAGGPGSPGGTGSSGNKGRGGGPGLLFSISGTPTWYAGGGGSGARDDANVATNGGKGGIGGGGDGGTQSSTGSNGTADTGGGGGGGGYNANFPNAGNGGSGVVIVKYYKTSELGILRYNTESNQLDAMLPHHGSVASDPTYNEATGGTIASFGGYKTHIFYNTTSTFTPTQTGLVELLVVAGGGGGGGNPTAGAGMAGGGAGGVIYTTAYPVTAGTTYTVVAGTGGAGGSSSAYTVGSPGTDSRFGNLIAIGGGFGGGYSSGVQHSGGNGGSGGGGGTRETYADTCNPGMGTLHQGNRGGRSNITGSPWVSAGGGGWGGSGGDATAGGPAGSGGGGGPVSIFGQQMWIAGGGGGSTYNVNPGIIYTLGAHGGGNGEIASGRPAMPGTGGGGGGGGTNGANAGAGGAGGNGVVAVRYRTKQIGDASTAATAAPNAIRIKEQTGTTTDGLYWIMIPQVGATQVYCDMNTAGGGWMHAGTISDSSSLSRNDASHIWGAPLNATQDTGIWENYSTYGSQSFTSNFKGNAWCYMPFREILIKDSGASLRNILRTKWSGNIPMPVFNSMSWFFGRLRWLADASDITTNSGALAGGMPFVNNARCVTWDVYNYGNNDPVFGTATRLLFKWGERDGVQDTNKDRSMISHEADVNVDAPKGIGCFTLLNGTQYYRNIVPKTEMTQDTPANAITGTHNITFWVR